MSSITNSAQKRATKGQKDDCHGVPKSRWRPIRVADLRLDGGELGTCQRCGRRDLRFLHTVAHPHKGELEVGPECARRLCYGYSPAREERRLRNLWARRSRWLTRIWGTSWNGNETLKLKRLDGAVVRVTVFPNRFGGYSWVIGAVGEQPVYSPHRYPSVDDAKLGAFDHLAGERGWAVA